MSLELLLSAPLEISVHAFVAMAAFALGAVQLAARKGTPSHRLLGWAWVAFMAVVALTSLFINTICAFGPFSLIHLLTLVTFISLFLGIRHACRGDITNHGGTMIFLFVGSLVIAGAFAFALGIERHKCPKGT